MESFLNYITRKYPDEYKKRFKKRFYDYFFFRSNNLWMRIFMVIAALVFTLLISMYFFKELRSWLSIPLALALLFIVNFSVSLRWTAIGMSYMDKKVLIPKKYNNIAVIFALLLLGLTVFIALKTIG